MTPTKRATGCSNRGASKPVSLLCSWADRLCSEAIEQTGRPESTKKLPRLSNPFGKKNTKAEWKEATMFELIPELEP